MLFWESKTSKIKKISAKKIWEKKTIYFFLIFSNDFFLNFLGICLQKLFYCLSKLLWLSNMPELYFTFYHTTQKHYTNLKKKFL